MAKGMGKGMKGGNLAKGPKVKKGGFINSPINMIPKKGKG